MSRLRRIVTIIAAVLIVLGVSLNFALKRMLMLDPIETRIAEQVESKFGRKLTVGSWSVTLFGGISARHIHIHDRAEFGTEPLFRCRLVRARMKIFPLLRGSLVIG